MDIEKVETALAPPVANGLATNAIDFIKQDLINILLAIQFADDSTHMDS
jgi:hypothetical protein